MRNKTTNILRLTNAVRKNIQKEKLFHSWHNLLITFSGGQDSAFCLLVLYLLKKKSKKKVPFYACTTTFFRILNAEGKSLQKRSVTKTLCINKKNNLLCLEKNKITDLYLTPLFFTSNTLLWCNHFWQKDAFFTMEHVSKLAFSKKYTIHLFAPVEKVISEQNARYWRHKMTQRSSFVICQTNRLLTIEARACTQQEHVLCTSEALTITKFWYFTQTLFLYSKHVYLKLCKGGFFGTYINKNKLGCYKDQCTSIVNQNYVLVRAKPFKSLAFYQPCLFVQESKRMNTFRAQAPTNLKSDQFIDLFLSKVLLAKPLLLTLIEKQNCNLRNHIRQSRITSTTFGLSEVLCVQGHNKSDRAEAILFNLIRGAGINGISTLQWKQTLNKVLLCYSYKKPQFCCANDVFYPIFSDFLKEISIIHLDIFGSMKEELKKKTDNKDGFSRLAILQNINFHRRWFFSRTQNSSYNIQSKAIDFEKLDCKGKSFAAQKQIKTNKNKAYYFKDTEFCYKPTNLHKTKSTNLHYQNKVKITMFYYQLKYKQKIYFFYK